MKALIASEPLLTYTARRLVHNLFTIALYFLGFVASMHMLNGQENKNLKDYFTLNIEFLFFPKELILNSFLDYLCFYVKLIGLNC